jgi:hypothetical protein
MISSDKAGVQFPDSEIFTILMYRGSVKYTSFAGSADHGCLVRAGLESRSRLMAIDFDDAALVDQGTKGPHFCA